MEVFVARQPIFSKNEDVFGYELLYRNNLENQFPNVNGDDATVDVLINGFLNIGFDQLGKGKPCFINFTEKLLKLKLPTYFKPNEIVVEILENIEPSLELLQICKDLKDLDYRIALDDFKYHEHNIYFYSLMRYIDIIKVDFRETTSEMRRKIEKLAFSYNIELLAEKIETREEFQQAYSQGYNYFQGYFFSEPLIVTTKDVPSYFYSYYEIISHLSEPEPDVETISRLIEQDLSLSYKLLKLINTPAFCPVQKITSIHQAIVLLGFVEINKWISVMAIRKTHEVNKEYMKELISISLTRAKTCESIARYLKKKVLPLSAYFLTGLYSLIDGILNMPMEKVLSSLPLHEEIVDALVGNDNHLRNILELSVMVEKGNWKYIQKQCLYQEISEEVVYSSYHDAMNWANQIMMLEMDSVGSN